MEAGADGSAGQSGVEGAVVGTEDFRRTEHFVKAASLDGPAAPLLERRVGPRDTQVRIDDGDAFAQDLQDAVGLEEGHDALTAGGIARGEEHAGDGLGLQVSQGFRPGGSTDEVPFWSDVLQRFLRGVRACENKNTRSFRHSSSTVARPGRQICRIIGFRVAAYKPLATPRAARRDSFYTSSRRR